jgi:hypothetical protein
LRESQIRAVRVRNHRPMPLHAFDATQTVSDAILAHVFLAQGSLQQLVAIHAQDMVRGCDPEPTEIVLREAQHLRMQCRGHLTRGLKLFRAAKGEAGCRPDPQHARRILEEAIHVLGGQTILRAITPPSIIGQGAKAARRGKPHGSVGALENRGNGVGGQAVGDRVVGEASILQYAHTRAESAGPKMPAAVQVYRINTVLSQPVGLGV